MKTQPIARQTETDASIIAGLITSLPSALFGLGMTYLMNPPIGFALGAVFATAAYQALRLAWIDQLTGRDG